MRYRALKGFSGLITMRKGEEKVIDDDYIVNDLLHAGYIEPCETKEKTTSSKGVKTNGRKGK